MEGYKIQYNFFETIVAGDNPKELMKEYDNTIKVEDYIVCKFNDAKKLKEKTIIAYKEIVNNNNIPTVTKEYYQEELEEIENMSDEDAFFYLTYDCDYDEDNNAISNKNPKGKYSFFQPGKLFSVPFITKDGNEVFQAHKGEIDWEKMHLHGTEIYDIAWEMVVNKRKPRTDYEKQIYENMKERTAYFRSFGNKENYVIHSTAFWAYAFVDKNNWYELEDNINQFTWVSEFYDRFIKPLNDNTLLTIYECKK